MILYICDRKACVDCMPDCGYTNDIEHAKNFKIIGETIAEKSKLVYREKNIDDKQETNGK